MEVIFFLWGTPQLMRECHSDSGKFLRVSFSSVS